MLNSYFQLKSMKTFLRCSLNKIRREDNFTPFVSTLVIWKSHFILGSFLIQKHLWVFRVPLPSVLNKETYLYVFRNVSCREKELIEMTWTLGTSAQRSALFSLALWNTCISLHDQRDVSIVVHDYMRDKDDK